jgi:hypothetical protein
VTDILNCPFCGNAGRISYSDRGETFSVRCVSWGAPATACMGSGPYAYSEADAIAAWNRRVLATPSTGAVGYVTVPAEPTEAMRQAFYGGDSIGLLPEWFAKSYRAMIAAAPPSSPSERDAAQLVEEMAEKEAPGRTKLMLTIAARAIRRGRHLTPAEQLANLSSWLDHEDTEAPVATLSSSEHI